MRLQPDALSFSLKKSILPIYVLYGNESFLIEESAKAIRSAFVAQKLGECTSISLENAAAWEHLEKTVLNRSLFCENRLIDIRLSSKIPPQGATLLTSLFGSSDPNLFFIFQCGSLNRVQQKAAWFTTADQKGGVIAHWPITQAAFTQWLKNRLIANAISPTPQLLSELSYYTEGNCLAAAQAIDQYALLQTDPHKTIPSLQDKQNQFSVFDLIEAALQQKSERTLHILQALKTSGTALPLLIWSLTQTLRVLSACEVTLDENEKINLLKKAGIKPYLQRIYIKRSVQKPSINRLYFPLQQLDHALKSGRLGDGWAEITSLALNLAGVTN